MYDAKRTCRSFFDNVIKALEKAVHDAGKSVEKGSQDTGKTIEKAAHDAGKTAEKAVIDAVGRSSGSDNSYIQAVQDGAYATDKA